GDFRAFSLEEGHVVQGGRITKNLRKNSPVSPNEIRGLGFEDSVFEYRRATAQEKHLLCSAFLYSDAG
ncbi:MAG: hypothetical protein L0J52_08880, partial [Corynebacterium casei]|uniref:hypothetical protein n=1 Tax=Corynebacterium casei TaxID=160386 RepID=UPI0026473360